MTQTRQQQLMVDVTTDNAESCMAFALHGSHKAIVTAFSRPPVQLWLVGRLLKQCFTSGVCSQNTNSSSGSC